MNEDIIIHYETNRLNQADVARAERYAIKKGLAESQGCNGFSTKNYMKDMTAYLNHILVIRNVLAKVIGNGCHGKIEMTNAKPKKRMIVVMEA